jgi:hypothetical protein
MVWWAVAALVVWVLLLAFRAAHGVHAARDRRCGAAGHQLSGGKRRMVGRDAVDVAIVLAIAAIVLAAIDVASIALLEDSTLGTVVRWVLVAVGTATTLHRDETAGGLVRTVSGMTRSPRAPRTRRRSVRVGVERVVLGWGMAAVALVMDAWVRRAIARSSGGGRAGRSPAPE